MRYVTCLSSIVLTRTNYDAHLHSQNVATMAKATRVVNEAMMYCAYANNPIRLVKSASRCLKVQKTSVFVTTQLPFTHATSPSDTDVQSTPTPSPSVEHPPQCSRSVCVSTHDPSQKVLEPHISALRRLRLLLWVCAESPEGRGPVGKMGRLGRQSLRTDGA